MKSSIPWILQLCGCKSETDSEQNSRVQLASGNVHLITSTQGWEDKISESSRDRKIVSRLISSLSLW